MKKHLLLASLISVLAVPASAQSFYVFGDLGQSKIKTSFEDEDGEDIFNFNDNDTTFDLGGGYNFNPYFSLEIAYRDLGGVSKGESYSFASYSFGFDFTALQVSALGKLPVNEVVDLYGRLGFGRIKAKFHLDYEYTGYYSESESDSESKNRGVFGLGASFKVTDKLALRAEYNQFAKWEELKLSSLTAGVTYSF